MQDRGAIGFVTMAIAAGVACAGPLDPPAGPISSRYKTLTEVEPRIALSAANAPGDSDSQLRIVTSGSYYLTGNVTGAANKAAIEIAADDVTIDLNGFVLQGVAGSLSGVTAVNRTNITVQNGTVRGFGARGVSLSGGSNHRVRDLTAEYNGTDGVAVGSYSRVERVNAHHHLGLGARGIFSDTHCRVSDCTTSDNVYGVEVGAYATVRNCESRRNNDGFHSSATTTTFESCVASQNSANGFFLGNKARVERCVASDNDEEGIFVGSNSRVADNTCLDNGLGSFASGIRTDGTRSVIERNTCSFADFGIRVLGTDNIVLGNRCSLNGANFEIDAGNRVAKIVILPTSGAISGATGGDSGNLTDPNANISY